MAETKRGGKVATPKLGPQGMVDADGLIKAVGARIRVTTTLPGTIIEGTIFTTCKTTNLLAIKDMRSPPAPPTPSSAAPGNYHIISLSQISSFEILGPANEADGAEAVVPSISKSESDALRQREEHAVREMKKWEASRGKGVSKEAQEIFDHIARTLPTRWNDQQIVINDAVLLGPPYQSSNVQAPKDKQSAVPQIKRVVEGYWAKKNSNKQSGQQQNNKSGGAPQGQQQNAGNSRPGVVMPIPPRKGG